MQECLACRQCDQIGGAALNILSAHDISAPSARTLGWIAALENLAVE